jgi:hypothetical protein
MRSESVQLNDAIKYIDFWNLFELAPRVRNCLRTWRSLRQALQDRAGRSYECPVDGCFKGKAFPHLRAAPTAARRLH